MTNLATVAPTCAATHMNINENTAPPGMMMLSLTFGNKISPKMLYSITQVIHTKRIVAVPFGTDGAMEGMYARATFVADSGGSR